MLNNLFRKKKTSLRQPKHLKTKVVKARGLRMEPLEDRCMLAAVTFVPFNGQWDYLHPTNAVDPNDADADFNTTWFTNDGSYDGPAFVQNRNALLGYGTINGAAGVPGLATNIGQPASGSRFSAYFTTEFNVDDPATVTNFVGRMLVDDGAFIYLNGKEVGQVNMPGGAVDQYRQFAANATATESTLRNLTFDPADLVAGTNIIAVSAHQAGPTSSDLGMALELTATVPDPPKVLVNQNAFGRAFTPFDDLLEMDWNGSDPTFVDASWDVGLQGIGFDNDPADGVNYSSFFGANFDLAPLINDGLSSLGSTSVYLRIPFTVSAVDLTNFQSLILNMRYDDGFVAYINGTPVAAKNAPAVLNDKSEATQSHDASATFESLDITSSLGALVAGNNLLAIHVMNVSLLDADMLSQAELLGGFIPSTLNTPPTAVDDLVEANEGDTFFDIAILANDFPGSAPLNPNSVEFLTDPQHGTLTYDSVTELVTYNLNPGELDFTGQDSFTYRVFDTSSVDTELLAFGSNWRYLDDGTSQDGLGNADPADGTWFASPSFNDNTWQQGLGQLGYDTNGVDIPVTELDFGGDPANKFQTYYFRSTFDLDDPTEVTEFTINTLLDDGAVIYINGIEVARPRMPLGTIDSTTFASTGAPETLETINIPNPAVFNLVAGSNDITVEVHQVSLASSDLIFDLELKAIIASGRASNEATVTIDINSAPIAVDDLFDDEVIIGVPTVLPILDNDIDNETTPENSWITFVSPPSFGTVSNAGGVVTYTPDGSPVGTIDTFTYFLTDNRGATSNIATVTIEIVAARPVGIDDNADVNENEPSHLSSIAIDVLANDSATTNPLDPTSVLIESSPSKGTVVIDPVTGVITYTPNFGEFGTDTFEYSVGDIFGQARSFPTEVVINIRRRPGAVDDPTPGTGDFVVNPGETGMIEIRSNDFIPFAGTTTIEILTSIADVPGTFTFSSITNEITYSAPATGFEGQVVIEYRLVDSSLPTLPDLFSDTATVSIRVGDAVSFTGYVYADLNDNGVKDDTTYPDGRPYIESGLPGRMVTLSKVATALDPNEFSVTVLTDSDGFYNIQTQQDGSRLLPGGLYKVTQIQPFDFIDGKEVDPAIITGVSSSVVVTNDEYSNLFMSPGATATNLNFGEKHPNPDFLTIIGNLGNGFLASQQSSANLSANALVVTYDAGWDGNFQADVSFDPSLGNATITLYDQNFSVVATSSTQSTSEGNVATLNYDATLGQPLLMHITGGNPEVEISAPTFESFVGDDLPGVQNVMVSSTQWSQSFLDYLNSEGLGTDGFNLSNLNNSVSTLPWTNIDQVKVQFSEQVQVAVEHLALYGVSVYDYVDQIDVIDFNYDVNSRTATWTLAESLDTDRLLIQLNDGIQDNTSNLFSSGSFSTEFSVLPGRTDQFTDKATGISDVISHMFSTASSPRYSPYTDFNGNGSVDLRDLLQMKVQEWDLLPFGTPGEAPQAPAALVVSFGPSVVISEMTDSNQTVETNSNINTPIQPNRLSTLATPVRTARVVDRLFSTSTSSVRETDDLAVATSRRMNARRVTAATATDLALSDFTTTVTARSAHSSRVRLTAAGQLHQGMRHQNTLSGSLLSEGEIDGQL